MPENERSRPGASRLDDMIGAIWEESTRLETVLVVHGYASLREALVRTLEHYGYRALEAANREQAVRVIMRDRPDLALVDLALGENDGPALASMLSARVETRGLPVVALSSDVVAPDRLRLHGFRDALVMPVEQRDLLAALDRALEPARRRRRDGLAVEGGTGEEQCRLPLEDGLRSEHLTLFSRFHTSTAIELRPGNESLIRGVTSRLEALGIQPEITLDAGELALHYELTIADAFSLGTTDPCEELFQALVAAFPELAPRPEPLRRRIATLEAEYRRLQRIAS
jgi:CheY-like chemotaxis protein